MNRGMYISDRLNKLKFSSLYAVQENAEIVSNLETFTLK
jgi:hypothetical protein